MFRRLFWLSVGVGAGATAVVLLSRWTQRQRERLAPTNVARRVGGGIAGLGSTLVDAVKEFREASVGREAEIRARLGEEKKGQ